MWRVDWTYKALATLQFFIGIGGIAGGIGLILSPSGATLGFSPEILERSPFESFLVPGLVLFSVNGVGSCIGSVFSFRRSRAAPGAAIGLGCFLLLWICAQAWWIGLQHWLQPAYFVLGLVELALGFKIFQPDKESASTAGQ